MNESVKEDIEFLSRKGNISVPEAEELLASHKNDLALALLDLEQKETIPGSMAREASVTRGGFVGFISKMFGFRIHVNQGERSILNISLLSIAVLTLCICLLPKLTFPLVIVLFLTTGCRIRIQKTDEKLDTEGITRNFRTIGNRARKLAERITNRLNHG